MMINTRDRSALFGGMPSKLQPNTATSYTDPQKARVSLRPRDPR